MVDSLLSDIGIDGSNLSRQSLLREASDLSRVKNLTQRLESAEKPKLDSDEELSGDRGGKE